MLPAHSPISAFNPTKGRSKQMKALPNDPMTAIRDAVQRIEPALVDIRRDIHAHPELGFEEVRTAGVVSRELSRLGIAHHPGIGKTGVVGLIEGGRPGPVLAIRADMDALPIQETSGLPRRTVDWDTS
jgi:metal-dependent amidase/aminoacylase/carboxypeptidase family protein